jgi:hypothetical protein
MPAIMSAGFPASKEAWSMTSASWSAVGRFGVPAFILGVCLAGAMGMGQVPEARAQAPRIPEAGGMLAFTSSGQGNSQWLYLIDTRNQAFAIYRVDPNNPKGTVKLEAARHFQCDLKLAEYNNLPPEVAAIEAMVRTAK